MSTTQIAPAKEIKLTNVGPIERLTISIPSEGGVAVLKGRNGTGKSHALNAIKRLAGGDDKIPVKDGTLMAEADGFGVKVVVSKNTKRLGELEIHSLESVADIGDLVDPGIDEPAAADKRRINVLLRMSGVKPDKSMFSDLLNGHDELFEQVVSPADITTDIVETAGRVKRKFEERARHNEAIAKEAEAKVTVHSADLKDIDLSLANQVSSLRQAHETAIAAKSAIIATKEEADKAFAAAADAQRQIDNGQKFSETSEQIAAHGAELRQQIHEAESRLQLLKADMVATENLFKAVRAHESSISTWQATIDIAKNTIAPSAAEIAAANQAAENAKAQYEAALYAERMSKKADELKVEEARLRESTLQAELFRAAAKGTEDVLARALNLKDLRLTGGRLVTNTARGVTFFSELSDGERWKMSLDIAAQFVGKNGLIVAPQHAWESVDPINRKDIANHCAKLGVVLITAEATENELCSEIFSQ